MERLLRTYRGILLATILVPFCVFLVILFGATAFSFFPRLSAVAVEEMVFFSPAFMSGVALAFLILLPFLAYKVAKLSNTSLSAGQTVVLSLMAACALMEFILGVAVLYVPTPYRVPCGTTNLPQPGILEPVLNVIRTVDVGDITGMISGLAIVGALVVMFVTLWLLHRHNKSGEPSGLKLILVASEILIVVSMIVLLYSGSLNNARVKSRNARRITDVKQIQLALELYWDGERREMYPVSYGDTPEERWQSLRVLAQRQYIPQIPEDPCADIILGGDRQQYDYATSPDGKRYVLRALLDDPSNTVLDSDVDGNIFGVWCGEQGWEIEYCIMP